MNKVDLHVYKDKIRKIHKAAENFKRIHDEFNEFQDERIFNKEFDEDIDWTKLEKFFNDNEQLKEMLDEVEGTIKELAK